MTGEPIPPGVEAARVDIRKILGIPPGFPLWYRPPRPSLPVGPIGRAAQRIQEIFDDPVFRKVLGDSIT